MNRDPIRDLLDVVRAQAYAAGWQARRWSWRAFLLGWVLGAATSVALVVAWLVT